MNMYGLNEDDDLDELFNENSPIVSSEYVYRNNCNLKDQSRNDGGERTQNMQNGGTDSQFANLLQESLNKNLMHSRSETQVIESQNCTTSTTCQSFGSFSNLSFHSLLRRNIIDQVLTPMDQQSEDMNTLGNPVFSPFFGDTQASHLRSINIDQALTPTERQNEDMNSLPTLDNPVFSPFFGDTQASSHLRSINSDQALTPTDQQSEDMNSLPTLDNPVFSPFFVDTQASSHLRSINIDQALTPTERQNEDMNSLPTLENQVFSPFFGDTQASYHLRNTNEDRQLHSENSQLYSQVRQPNMIEHINSTIDQSQSQDSNHPHPLIPPKQPSQFHLTSERLRNQQQYNSSIISPSNMFGSYQPPEHIAANMSSIPKSILNLYKQIKESGSCDYAFIHALSAQTCQEFTPMDCYISLKKCLLLSIASINAKNDRVPIPIVAIGKDCSSADSIMNHIGNFAQRFLAPTDQIFNVSMNSDKFVQIGPVFMAKNGVCYLGHWSALTKSVSEEIQIILSSGRFFLNKSSENFKLCSAVWTHWSYTGNRSKDLVNVEMFLRYFGIPIVMDSDCSDTMIEFILEEAMSGQVEIPDDALDICYEDMKTYLNIIRKIDVTTTRSAQILIKSYVDAIRLDREDVLSPRGLEIIQQMSESYAKMCLRDTVLDCDVIAVIAIFEETIRGMTGVGIGGLGVSPAPILHNVQRIEEVDVYMKKFEKWLYHYVRMFQQS